MSGDNKIVEPSKTVSEIYGVAWDVVRSRHPNIYPPLAERYVEKIESASHVFRKVSESASKQSLQSLQKVLVTGDKSPSTKAREDETIRRLTEALEKEKNGSKTTPKKVKR